MAEIFACGDILNYSHPSGYVCSEDLASIIQNADYSICNFEAPISGFGKAQPKSGPIHSQQKHTINGLKDQGFNHFLLANNHIMDYGPDGLKATIEEIDKLGLRYTGADLSFQKAYKPCIININGLKICIINAAEAASLFGVLDYFQKKEAGHAWINHSLIDKNISWAKYYEKCDFVIVFSHAGLENYSIPQKEWRERYKHFCDLGADIVIGSHPHVPQGYECYNTSLIFYSLGNFYFDSNRYKNKEDRSFSALLKLERGSLPSFKPIYHHKSKGRVQLSPPEKRINLKELCSMLDNDYAQLHDNMSLEAYAKTRKNMIYSLMPIPYDGEIISSFKKLVNRFLGRKKKVDKTILQLHLLKNEAYYYAAKHALEVMAREKQL